MVARDDIPAGGEIARLRSYSQSGHEQAGHRPTPALSTVTYNEKSGLGLSCPIASAEKGYLYGVSQPHNSEVTGVVLADQVKSLDWRARRARFACQATAQVVREVLGKVNALLQ